MRVTVLPEALAQHYVENGIRPTLETANDQSYDLVYHKATCSR